MDVGEVYAQHDSVWCWLAAVFGHLSCPFIINSLVDGMYRIDRISLYQTH